MADVEDNVPAGDFDLSKKKKKKKPVKPVEDEEQQQQQPAEEGGDIGFDLKKKKKKKSKKTGEEEVTEGVEAMKVQDEDEEDVGQLLEQLKKGKKNEAEKAEEEEEAEKPEEEEEEEEAARKQEEAAEAKGEEEEEEEEQAVADFDESIWQKTDRDYTYPEILRRVYAQLSVKNPELSGTRKKYKLKVPQVAREGAKKTVFANFIEICKNMNRNPDHVLGYMMTELGTSGSLDGNERLVIKGRFQPKSIENLLRRYISDYVVCGMCKSLETTLVRDPHTRLHQLKCTNCGASRTVSAVKQGFVATVSRRNKT